MKHSNLYLGLVLPSGGWQSLIESRLVIDENIEIGLEQAPFFSSFEHVKSLLIMGPNNTKNSSLKCDCLIIVYE